MVSYKRYIKFALVIVGILLIVFGCVHFLSKGYTNNYVLKDTYNIKEIYTKDEQNEHDNYYLEITPPSGTTYNYQFYHEFDNNNQIVDDVVYYDGEYRCLLPILKDGVKVDFVCYKDGVYTNYQALVGVDEDLDNYISKLDKKIYDSKMFKDDETNAKEENKITYYPKNIPDGYIIALSTLKGIVIVSDGETKSVDIFDEDIYKREISAFNENYYITADYSDNQNFRVFYVVDLITGKEKILKAPDNISFDAYIQGFVGNKAYVYDVNNEKQYEIDLDNGEIKAIGSASRGISYYDGKWSYITAVKANNKLLFKTSKETYTNYASFDKIGNKLSGFYYFYEKDEDVYNVYRSFVQWKKLRRKLFTVDDYRELAFEEDYIFYKDGDTIKMYSDYTGIKTVVKTSELSFNENTLFGVYKK